MEDIAIKLTNVSMTYRISLVKVDSLKEYFIRKIKKQIQYKEINALSNVDLVITKGERIGIIGNNGAGKSTVLKVISKVIKPTTGTVETHGRIAPLLELGAGFDQELTGRKNIYLNAAILGKSKEFIESHVEEIIEYSELEEFIDIPLKNYSSGMKARLGFAIASKVDADIIILDEVLGVGDKHFKEKSSKTIQGLINSGKTVILVSHSLGEIRKLTDKTIWLEKGKVRMIDETNKVVDAYLQDDK